VLFRSEDMIRRRIRGEDEDEPARYALGGQVEKRPPRPDDLIEEVSGRKKVIEGALSAIGAGRKPAAPAVIDLAERAGQKVLDVRAAQMELPQDQRIKPSGEKGVIDNSIEAYEDTLRDLPQSSFGALIPRLPEGDTKYPLSGRVLPLIQHREALAEEAARSIEPYRNSPVRYFYHSGPKYDALRREGVDAEAFMSDFGGNYAATSPRSETLQNLRNASLLQYMRARGQPIDRETYDRLGNLRGYPMMGMHIDLADAFAAGRESLDKNPKPTIFRQNVMGNLLDVTSDTHDIRSTLTILNDLYPGAIPPSFLKPGARARYLEDPKIFSPASDVEDTLESVARNKVSRQVEYGPVSDVTRRASELLGVKPAEAQSMKWFAYGDRTGLASQPKTIIDLQNDLLDTTAQALGISPQEALRQYSRRKIPLLARGGGVRGALQLAAERSAPRRASAGTRR